MPLLSHVKRFSHLYAVEYALPPFGVFFLFHTEGKFCINMVVLHMFPCASIISIARELVGNAKFWPHPKILN